MLRKEYFDCTQRDSHAVYYITFKRGGSLYSSCTLYRRLGVDRDKIPEGGGTHRVHILVEMKQGQCICPLSWSVHCNFTGEGNCSERGWACTPHPYQPGYFYPHDGMYARKRPLPLCVLCGGTSTYILDLSDLFPMLQSKLEELEASSQQLGAAKTALEAELAAERTSAESLRAQAAQEAADLSAKLVTLTRQGGLPYFN
jgi:hypothetical protein